MPSNSMVAMLMVLIARAGEELVFTAEELDQRSHDLRHLIISEPFEEDGKRMIRLRIIERPGVQLGPATGRTM